MSSVEVVGVPLSLKFYGDPTFEGVVFGLGNAFSWDLEVVWVEKLLVQVGILPLLLVFTYLLGHRRRSEGVHHVEFMGTCLELGLIVRQITAEVVPVPSLSRDTSD